MEDMGRRPFYDQYAWAYDLLITPPIARQCDFIQEIFTARGVNENSRVLDAGCGTGRYAVELAGRGFSVSGVDASPQLIEQARKRSPDSGLELPFSTGNIILCRGVLNDLLEDTERRDVFHAFARALRSSGVLVLDVRNWEPTVQRKTREPVVEKAVTTSRGPLIFRSETHLDKETRQLVVWERHTLGEPDGETVSANEFRMKCWTVGELNRCLATAGFNRIEMFGAYDRDVSLGATDRIVCISQRAA